MQDDVSVMGKAMNNRACDAQMGDAISSNGVINAVGQQDTLIEIGSGPARMERLVMHGEVVGGLFSSQSTNDVPSDDAQRTNEVPSDDASTMVKVIVSILLYSVSFKFCSEE